MSLRSLLLACGVVGLLGLIPQVSYGQCSSGRQYSGMTRGGSIPYQGNTLRQTQLAYLIAQQRQLQYQALLQSQIQAQLQHQQALATLRYQQELQLVQSRITGLSDAALRSYTVGSNNVVGQLAIAELNRRQHP